MDQLSFASLDYAAKKKRTKRDVFLAEMAAVVPWVALEAVIEPHYPKAGPNGGRRPFLLAVMLRIYCLQQWYSLSDPGAEEALYDICSMRAFAGLELGRDAIPDETTWRHHCRRDADRGIAVDEERGAKARSGDALVEEGQPVVLWHEGTYRRRCEERARAHGGRDHGQRA